MRVAINNINAYVASQRSSQVSETTAMIVDDSVMPPPSNIRKRAESINPRMPRRVRTDVASALATLHINEANELSLRNIQTAEHQLPNSMRATNQQMAQFGQQISEHNQNKYGAAWQAWAATGMPAEGNRQEAVRRMSKFPGTTGIRTLYLDGLNLTSLPENLPDMMKGLSLKDNALSELPQLPMSLKSLSLDGNKFTRFPENLPDSIERLSLSGNYCIASMPSILPNALLCRVHVREDLVSIVKQNQEITRQIMQNRKIERLMRERPDVAQAVIQNNEMVHMILQKPETANLILEQKAQAGLIAQNQNIARLLA